MWEGGGSGWDWGCKDEEKDEGAKEGMIMSVYGYGWL